VPSFLSAANLKIAQFRYHQMVSSSRLTLIRQPQGTSRDVAAMIPDRSLAAASKTPRKKQYL